jgi:hypothetical protein
MVDTAVIDCITIDANGTVREVEPMSFESVKGTNLERSFTKRIPHRYCSIKSSSMYLDYPELLNLSDRMSIERTGYGTCGFLDHSHGETIKKGCYWTTIPNVGTEMRLVLTLVHLG